MPITAAFAGWIRRNTTFALLATPTAVQRRALDLLGLKPAL
jgi:hypothetical protein